MVDSGEREGPGDLLINFDKPVRLSPGSCQEVIFGTLDGSGMHSQFMTNTVVYWYRQMSFSDATYAFTVQHMLFECVGTSMQLPAWSWKLRTKTGLHRFCSSSVASSSPTVTAMRVTVPRETTKARVRALLPACRIHPCSCQPGHPHNVTFSEKIIIFIPLADPNARILRLYEARAGGGAD